MGRFRIGSKEISLILDGTVQEGELFFENEQNNEAPAKLFVDADGKLKFRNRGDDPRFIGDGTVTGQTRSVIQGDRNPNEYQDMSSSTGLTDEQIEYFNDVKAARVGDSYIDNENFILYVKKREFQQGALLVWVQRGSAFRGEDGDPTVNGILSNEMHTVASTIDGSVTDTLADAGGRFTVYDGTSIASNVIFSASTDGILFTAAGIPVSSGGVRLTIDSNGYYNLSQSVTGWSKNVDAVTFILRAMIGALVIDKVYKIMKSKGGALLRLVTDRQAFTRDGQGNFAPTQQTARLTAQLNNISTDALITWKLFKLAPDNQWIEILNPLDYLDITDNVALLDEQKFGDAIIALNIIGSAIKVRAQVGTIFDEITFITVADGAQGEIGPQGADGASPYNGILTNESHTVPSKEDGTEIIGLGIVPSNKAGGFYRIYEGTSLLTSGVDFSAVGGSSSNGVSIVTQNGLKIEVNETTGEYSLFETSVNSWVSDSETFSIRATVNGVDIDKTYTITKSKGGANAKLLYLYSDRQTITVDGEGSLSPQNQTVRFSAKLQNITANSVTWTLERDIAGIWTEVANAGDYLSTLATTGDSIVTLTLDQIKYEALFSGTITSIRVTAAADGFDDSISIAKVKDGARGIAYTGHLTNESHLVAASYEGVVSDDLTTAGGYFIVYKGDEIATDTSFSVLSSPQNVGITAQINSSTGQYTISQNNWSTDTATFTFRATLGTSGEFIDKTYTISKSKAGVNGEPARLIYLTSTSQAFKKDGTDSYAPDDQVIEFTASLQNMTVTSATWELYYRNGNTSVKINDLTGKLSTAATSATMSTAQHAAILAVASNPNSQVIVRAVAEGLSDDISLSVIKDGTDGQGSFSAFLTNESHLVAADVAGIVTNEDLQNSGAGGSFIVFEGTQEVSADYSIQGGLSAGSYYEKVIDGLTCRIDKYTGEYEVFQDSGDTWITSSKSVSFTLLAVVGTSTISKVFSVSKSLAGANGESAKIVYLTTDSQSFTLDGNGNLSPAGQVITFNASLQNITSSAVTWGISRWITEPVPGWSSLTMTDSTFLTADDTSATMSYTQYVTALGTGKFVKVKASVDSQLYDEVTVVRLRDGATGKNAINGLLTNESHTVAANSDGSNVLGLGSAGGQFVVYVGDEIATSGVSYFVSTNGEDFESVGTAVNESGLLLSISSNGTYTLTEAPGGWLSDTAVFQLKASVVGYPSIVKTYTITKSKGGVNAKLLYLSTDRLAFTKNSSGAYSPTSQITNFTATKQNLGTTATEWSVYKLVGTVWTQLTGSLSQYLTEAGDTATMNQSQFNLALGGTTSVKVTAECDGVSDEVSIFAVADGANGVDGIDGTPGADGVNAKAIKLVASSYQVAYNSVGGEPNPTSITLTATGQNLSPGSTYEFLLGTTVIQAKSTTNTYTISISDYSSTFATGAPLSYTVKAYEGNTIVADDVITIIGTKEGASTISVVLSNSTHAFTADANGNIISEYDDGATGIVVFEGNNKLDAVSTATLSNGQFRVVATPTNISVGSGVVQLDGKEIVFTPSAMLQSSPSAKISYTIYVKGSTGVASQLTQIQTFSKSKAGQEGASGTSAMVVKLSSTMYQIPYNSAGVPVTSGNFTLTAEVQNHIPASYVFEKSINNGSSYEVVTSSGNSATIVIPSVHFTTPVIYRVTTLDDDGIQKAQDTIAIFATKDGASSLTPILTNSTHAFPANASGVITSLDYAAGATDIFLYEGNSLLTPVSNTTDLTGQLSKFKIQTTESGIDVLESIDAVNKKITFTPQNGTMLGDSANVSYSITAIDSKGIQYSYTQTQTFSKSKQGQQGAQGEIGESGAASKLLKLSATKLFFTKAATDAFEPASQSIELNASLQNLSTQTLTNSNWSIKKITSSGLVTLTPISNYITINGNTAYINQNQFQNIISSDGYGVSITIFIDDLEDVVTISESKNGSITKIWSSSLVSQKVETNSSKTFFFQNSQDYSSGSNISSYGTLVNGSGATAVRRSPSALAFGSSRTNYVSGSEDGNFLLINSSSNLEMSDVKVSIGDIVRQQFITTSDGKIEHELYIKEEGNYSINIKSQILLISRLMGATVSGSASISLLTSQQTNKNYDIEKIVGKDTYGTYKQTILYTGSVFIPNNTSENLIVSPTINNFSFYTEDGQYVTVNNNVKYKDFDNYNTTYENYSSTWWSDGYYNWVPNYRNVATKDIDKTYNFKFKVGDRIRLYASASFTSTPPDPSNLITGEIYDNRYLEWLWRYYKYEVISSTTIGDFTQDIIHQSYGGSTQTVTIPITIGSPVTLTQPNAIVRSQNWSSNYPSNANGYIIAPALGPSTYYTLTGGYSTESGYDFISIYEGSIIDSTKLLAQFSGIGSMNFTSPENSTISIRFSSDGSNVSTGFSLNLTARTGGVPTGFWYINQSTSDVNQWVTGSFEPSPYFYSEIPGNFYCIRDVTRNDNLRTYNATDTTLGQHLWKDINLSSIYNNAISFGLDVVGEKTSGVQYDYVMVSVKDLSTNTSYNDVSYVVGTAPTFSAGPGWIRLEKIHSFGGRKRFFLPESLNGKKIRIVFTWANDSAGGVGYGAAINDIRHELVSKTLETFYRRNPMLCLSVDTNDNDESVVDTVITITKLD